MVQTMKKLKSGYINGTRVMLGNLGDFLNTSAITDLSFLGSQEDGYPDSKIFLQFLNIDLNNSFLSPP
jgi:phosphorylase kinase alpha/beta subunit